MIPKIIHLCWLSGDPFPQDIKKCLESWKEHLMEYEIWLWGKTPEEIKSCDNRLFENGPRVIEKSFDLDSTLWTKQAFEAKKYAFAADYIRMYALYNYGGIYLDADVLVYKPFDQILDLPYFIGCDRIGSFEAAVIGCEKECCWIEDVLDHYKDRTFVKANGEFDMLPLPSVMKDELVRKGYFFRKYQDNTRYSCDDDIFVFSADYFNSRDHLRVKKTKNSYCAHNYLGSWMKNKKSFKDWLKMTIPSSIMNCYFKVSHSMWDKHKYDDVKIPFKL